MQFASPENQGQPGTTQSQVPLGGQNGGVQYAATAQPGYTSGYGAPQCVPGGYQVVTSGAPEVAYPQQTYQPPPVPPGRATVPAYPQPVATGTGPAQGGPPPPPVLPGQQGQGDAIQPQQQQSFSQYQGLPPAGGGGPVGVPPQSFACQQSVPIYYPSTSVASSNGLSIQTSYPVQASTMTSMAVSQVTVTGQQGSYRPRSPPSQGGVPSMVASSSQTSVNGITVSPSTPHYVTYTTSYPQCMPASQRVSTPGMIPFQAQSPPQAATNFSLVRPNMQINMQMAAGARTSPSVGGATGQYLQAQVPTIVGGVGPSGQPVKFITVDQRVFTSTDNSKDIAPNGTMTGTSLGAAVTSMALPGSGIPKAVSVRPTGATITYRAPVPINPGTTNLYSF